MRLADLAAHPLIVGERMQHADALRAREHQVVAADRLQPLRLLAPLARVNVERADGDCPLPHRLPQPLLVRRIDAAQQCSQVAVADDADEAQSRRATPRPEPRRLAATRVVVVQPSRDLLLVIRLLAQRQLRHTQHPAHPPAREGAETHMHRRCEEQRAFTARATPQHHADTTANAQNPDFVRRTDRDSGPRNPC